MAVVVKYPTAPGDVFPNTLSQYAHIWYLVAAYNQVAPIDAMDDVL